MSQQQGLALLFLGDYLLFSPDRPGQVLFPMSLDAVRDTWQADTSIEIGQWQGQRLWAVSVSKQAAEQENFESLYLKRPHPLLPPALFTLALRGKQLLHWQRQTRFCGACGHLLRLHELELMRVCHICGASYYPKYAPAVIVRITRGREILLARGEHFPEGLYSHIAGFIEIGESAEEAIVREVREEVNLEIQNIQYFGSQPWPFPDSYMLAFTAEYLSGDLKIDGVELTEAAWFSPENLPTVPESHSISRTLFDDYYQGLESSQR
jgi:NAD+ diphosphatase